MISINPIKTCGLFSPLSFQNNTSHPKVYNKLQPAQDKVELSFCGAFEYTQFPIRLDQAQCYSGIHCPSCGVQMITPQDFEQIVEKSANCANGYDFVQLLDENKKFIPKKFRQILNDIKNIHNYKELSVPELINELSEISFYKKLNTTRQVKEYLIENAQKYPDSMRIPALNTVEKIKTRQNYNVQKELIFQYTNDINVNKDEKVKLIKKVSDPLFDSNGYYMLFNSYNISDMQEKDLLPYITRRIFYPSLSGITQISKLPEHFALSNNHILLCKNCYPMQLKNFFGQYSDKREIKDNIRAYLTDISYLMGDNKIDKSPDYIDSTISIINRMSKQNIIFSPNEIKSIKHVERLMKRHGRFAPIEQSEVDIPCAECGSPMLAHAKRKEIEYELKKCNTPYEYANVLRNNLKYVGVHNKVLAEIFLQVAEVNPNISTEKFLREFYKKELHYCEKSIENSINRFLSNRSYIAENFSKESLNTYDKFTSRLLKYISDGKFKNYQVGPMYQECLANLDLHTYPIKPLFILLRDIKSIAYKHLNVYSFDRNRYNDKDEIYSILFKMFQQNVATSDHLVPIIKGGSSDRYNLIGLCKSCNKTKSRKEVSNWYSENKNLADNLKKQLIVINDMAKSGRLDGYDDWAKEIAQKVYELTYNKLDLRNEID